MTRILCFAALSTLALTGCNVTGDEPGPDAPSLIPTMAPAPFEHTEVASRTAIPLPMQSPAVGVTVDPDTGAQYVLDASNGMFLVTESGLEEVASWQQLVPIDGWDRRPYTDAVAVGGGKFAVTVESDGLLFDLETKTTTQHFCYEPGFMETGGDWIETYQLTNSVSYNPITDQIVAQPQTFGDGPLIASIGLWDREIGGQPTAWFDLPWADFSAGGIVMDSEDRILMGRGALLFQMKLGQDGEPTPMMDLAEFGVIDIAGLALAPNGNLVVLNDGPTDELVEIANWKPELTL